MSSATYFTLNTGSRIPAIGIGCWMGKPGDSNDVTEMVKAALTLGYRHIDTAYNYGNEESVGIALQETNIPRGEIFLTTKLDQNDHGRVLEAVNKSIKKLGVTYIDLYLMHWPMAYDESGRTLQPDESPTFIETWKEMEKLAISGVVKAIGVSNFSIKTLEALLEHANIAPAVNQVELHPCLPQHDLLDFCSGRNILLTAYSPVGKHKFADSPPIAEIAGAHGASSAQVLLSWGVQRGTVVIPKAVQQKKLKENLAVIQLTAAEMEALDALHLQPGMHRSVCGFHSAELGGSCFGWTYEQLGWDLVTGGIHM